MSEIHQNLTVGHAGCYGFPEPAPPFQDMPRKVKQLSGDYHNPLALCYDGTMWALDMDGWHELPAIPQPGDKQCHQSS